MGSKTALWNLSEAEMDDLELYPPIDPFGALRRGVRAVRANWRRALAYTLVILVVFGTVGYRWVTTVTPMDSTRAVELFRAEQDAEPSGGIEGSTAAKKKRSADKRGEDKRPEGQAGEKVVTAARASGGGNSAADDSRERNPAPSTGTAGSERRFSPPKEGVYSWATDGYEQVSGARRQFPSETQRILTFDGEGRWTEHHYFSEERESWTSFHWGERGAEIEQQRNKVTFGPVTNNSTIDFSPPMLVGPRDLKVGYRWGDSWQGDTSGDYSSEIFERTTLTIGGKSVEVWGISYQIDLRGKQEGRVTAEVWLAAERGIVVKEHYEQDIESSGARYQAEWEQTLKSLEPRQ